MTARLEPSGHNRDVKSKLFCLDGNGAASDRGRVGATSHLTPHESIAAKYCDGVFVCLSRVEKVTVPYIDGETVVTEGVDDFAGVRIDLLYHALAAERSFRQDGAFRTESYPAALPTRVFDQVGKAVQATEEIDRSAAHALLLVSDVEAEVPLAIHALRVSDPAAAARAKFVRRLLNSDSSHSNRRSFPISVVGIDLHLNGPGIDAEVDKFQRRTCCVNGNTANGQVRRRAKVRRLEKQETYFCFGDIARVAVSLLC